MIAVVGAGAIGGLPAAELVALGHEMTLCARRRLSRVRVERAFAPRDAGHPLTTRTLRRAVALRAGGLREPAIGLLREGVAVVRAADRHGIDVPLNRAIRALLEGLDGAA